MPVLVENNVVPSPFAMSSGVTEMTREAAPRVSDLSVSS